MVLLGLMGMLVLYFAIHLVVNRGKIKISYLVTALFYSFAVGIPVAYYSLFPDKLRPVLYITYYAVFLFPYLGIEIYGCVKKRQTWTRFVFIFSGLVLILGSPFVAPSVKPIFIGAGMLLITGFFIHLFRYPHLNAMWLADAAHRAAENVEKNCRYSSKPVVLPVPSKKTSCAESIGLFLLFKRNAAVVKVSKKLHDKLGNPNMERYAEELVKIIKRTLKDIEDSPQNEIK
jgi:hypothetical protein